MAEDRESVTYKDSGVDVGLGERCSRIAYETCKATYKNREGRFGEPVELEGGFSGPLRVNMPVKGNYLVKNTDGVGSKVIVAQKTGVHSTVAFDLIAMNADDAVSVGAEPFAGTNFLDVKDMDPELVKQLMDGLEKACDASGIAMVGGEIAELGEQVKGHDKPYIWNADTLGVLEKGKYIDGSDISAGDAVVAIRSNGIRSNGMTLARKICRDRFGVRWHEEKLDSGSTWGEALLKPSKICCSALLDVIGRYGEPSRANITGLVHITGGGMKNLRRVLPSGLGAELNDLFEPHAELKKLQELGPVEDSQAYNTWNMGQCFLLTTPEPDKVMEILKESGLECKASGEVVEGGDIQIESKGLRGGKLKF